MKSYILSIFGVFVLAGNCNAQTLHLFSPDIKKEYPSVVYDFLERYLFRIDSIMQKCEDVSQRLHDDKVIFTIGDAGVVRTITPQTPVSISKNQDKYFEVVWKDSLDGPILGVAFPMQYELILGQVKNEIEKAMKQTLLDAPNHIVMRKKLSEFLNQEDGCLMTQPLQNYYVESLNTATYYKKDDKGNLIPQFSGLDKWHSAANLFQGLIENVDRYTLYVEQNLYGYRTAKYSVPLSKWLGYCESMKLKIYFAIEEERQDGLKALLIAHSDDLGFNHMMSLIIPDNFVEKENCIIKGTMNAYIPTQNIKNLYQQYTENPKKKI